MKCNKLSVLQTHKIFWGAFLFLVNCEDPSKSRIADLEKRLEDNSEKQKEDAIAYSVKIIDLERQNGDLQNKYNAIFQKTTLFSSAPKLLQGVTVTDTIGAAEDRLINIINAIINATLSCPPSEAGQKINELINKVKTAGVSVVNCSSCIDDISKNKAIGHDGNTASGKAVGAGKYVVYRNELYIVTADGSAVNNLGKVQRAKPDGTGNGVDIVIDNT